MNEPKTITITPSFEFGYEVHNRSEFQSAGHFVPGLTTQHGGFRREWIGPSVHIATLSITLKMGEETGGVAPDQVQALRIYSDSQEDLQWRAAEELKRTFAALVFASKRQTDTAEAYRLLNDAQVEREQAAREKKP